MTTREQLRAARRHAEMALETGAGRFPDDALTVLLQAHHTILLALLDDSGLEGKLSDADHAEIMDDILSADIGDR